MTPAKRNKQTRGQGRTTEFPRLLGGRLCLHFANTVEGPLSDHPVDFLRNYDDLVGWSWHAGVLERADADRLLAAARDRPNDAAAVFEQAVLLREAIVGAFRGIARSATPGEADLAHLHREYAGGLAEARLAASGGGFALSWEGVPGELRRPLWIVAGSAVELLTEGDLSRIKQCPGAGDCGWLFYDTSRNGTRRWCSMEGCGSRVKMRRQYARRQRRA
jgi:predicted RNA-binding Zn ribbon-like protein